MKTIAIILSGIGIFLFAGCADTNRPDCRILLESEPSPAEIWEDDYFVGVTPSTLRYTITTEDADRGYLALPPFTIRKEGYKPYPLQIKVDLEEGYDWGGLVVLEKEEEETGDTAPDHP